MNTNQVGSMCRKIKLIGVYYFFYTIFTKGFNVTKLAMLSTAKHLKYSMKYTDLGVNLKDP